MSAIPPWVWLLAAAAPPITVLGTLAALTCIGGTKTRRAQDWPGDPDDATTYDPRWDEHRPGAGPRRARREAL